MPSTTRETSQEPSPAAPGAGADGDFFGHDAILAPVAESALLIAGTTPLAIGVFGGPGSGKTLAMRRLQFRIEALAAAAARLRISPFLTRPVIVNLTAAEFACDPAPLAAGALRMALTKSGGDFAAIAAETAEAIADPHTFARDIAGRLDAARDRLDLERKALDDLEGRKNRLLDTILYEASGSRIDAFARARRSVIDSRLRGFGFDGDSLKAFKELAREASERPGRWGKLAAFTNALWAYKGQLSLLVRALLLYLFAWGCSIANDNANVWLSALRSLGDSVAPVANFAEGRLDWLERARQGALLLALAFLALNVWRALRFLLPIWRGAQILSGDAVQRRGQIEIALAHQTRRVDTLVQDIEHLSDVSAQASARAEGRPALGAASTVPGIGTEAPEVMARAFIAGIAACVARGEAGKPQRIVFCLDGFEALSPERAAEALNACHQFFAQPGFVLVASVDPHLLLAAGTSAVESTARFERWFDIPVNLPDASANPEAVSAYARALMNRSLLPQPAPIDASRSSLSSAPTPVEIALISALAPVAAV